MDVVAGIDRNNLDVKLFVTNVTNKIAELSRFTQTNPANDNQVYILPAQPRTVGIELSQKF
jgi:outer membrane receptor protein involved in Fe transport